jgi:protein-S-isoprenylcysteine O-methyltransferase Ste14
VSPVSRRALSGFIRLQGILALLLFLPAGSLRFWQAWIFWTVFCTSVLVITLYFLRHDPGLVERRLNVGPAAEPQRSQKIIQAIASVLFCTLLIVPGLDHRMHWSTVPIPIVLMGDVLVAIGFAIVFRVFRENRHTASIVTVEAGQQVISTGPYRLVRHPMYAGGALALMAMPFALGSLYALLVAVPLCGVVVARLLNEERYLSAHLPGYDAYRERVRYRLMPPVW